MNDCVFCNTNGGEVLYQNDLFRIIFVDDKDYPGYLRVVASHHVKELTDLSDEDNLLIYQAVIKCEKIIRKVMPVSKINIASFGNMTPHIHWHIIPRYIGDKHFPNPSWGEITNIEYQPDLIIINASKYLKHNFISLYENA